jgi:hypothetical protein
MQWDWAIIEKVRAVGSFLNENIPLIALILTCFVYKRWRKERREEKKSLIAEEALNFLESSISQTTSWLFTSMMFFVFNKHSPEYVEQLQLASEDKKKQLLEEFGNDPHEVRNFVRSFNAIADEFIRAKNRAFRLNNFVINDKFESMHLIIKSLQSKVTRHYRVDIPVHEKIKLSQFLSGEAPEELERLFESARSLLNDVMLFQSTRVPQWMYRLFYRGKKLIQKAICKSTERIRKLFVNSENRC